MHRFFFLLLSFSLPRIRDQFAGLQRENNRRSLGDEGQEPRPRQCCTWVVQCEHVLKSTTKKGATSFGVSPHSFYQCPSVIIIPKKENSTKPKIQQKTDGPKDRRLGGIRIEQIHKTKTITQKTSSDSFQTPFFLLLSTAASLGGR